MRTDAFHKGSLSAPTAFSSFPAVTSHCRGHKETRPLRLPRRSLHRQSSFSLPFEQPMPPMCSVTAPKATMGARITSTLTFPLPPLFLSHNIPPGSRDRQEISGCNGVAAWLIPHPSADERSSLSSSPLVRRGEGKRPQGYSGQSWQTAPSPFPFQWCD